MGLLDVLNGMQNGPRGPSNPSAQSGGGMSPMTMAILGLLAWKAVKHLTAGQAGCNTGTRTRHGRQCRAWRRRSRWSAPGRAGRPAGRRRRRQRDQRRARRPAQAIAAERPRRYRQFMGEPGSEQVDFAWRSRQRARCRSDQQPDVAERPVARRIAFGPQPAFARRGQPFDTGRAAADRKRSFGPALTLVPAIHLPHLSRPCFFREGR